MAALDSKVKGYLFYQFGYDPDSAARNLDVIDLYVNQNARGQGTGKALMTVIPCPKISLTK